MGSATFMENSLFYVFHRYHDAFKFKKFIVNHLWAWGIFNEKSQHMNKAGTYFMYQNIRIHPLRISCINFVFTKLVNRKCLIWSKYDFLSLMSCSSYIYWNLKPKLNNFFPTSIPMESVHMINRQGCEKSLCMFPYRNRNLCMKGKWSCNLNLCCAEFIFKNASEF